MISHPRRSVSAPKVQKAAITAGPTPKLRTVRKPAAAKRSSHDADYALMLANMREIFAVEMVAGTTLFQTDATGLYELYLDSLPAERQIHTCNCCRKFVETYGGLVQVMSNGDTNPAIWYGPNTPAFYAKAFSALFWKVKKARIVSPFKTTETTWGVPQTGAWTHLAVTPPAALVYRERALTPFQAMAAAKENYRTVITALKELTAPMLDQALRLFEAESLARSEKFIGPVKWLRALHDRPKGRAGENLLWLAVATAPEGYCHPRASVLAPLLDDIAAGVPFQRIKQKFDAMLGPLQYQRPQAPPSAGNIRAAEALVEKLGIARSLERRFARPDEIEAIWVPADTDVYKSRTGTVTVFSHLKPKGVRMPPPVNLPTMTMTWDKFMRTVMVPAMEIEFYVPPHGNFIALTTAEHLDAPPILKWDRDDERNPVAWYVYPGGSPARQWGLVGNTWAAVTGIAQFPNLWGSRPMPFHTEGVILLLDGAADDKTGSGNALFPECLKDELHGARATIEAYSKSAVIGGRGVPNAAGYDVRKGGQINILLRVFAAGAWTSYRIDRWD